MPELGAPFDFRERPPATLVLAKPLEQDAYEKEVLKHAPGGWPLMSMLKHNGWRILVTIVPDPKIPGGTVVRMFTDGGQKRVDAHLPHIVGEISQLPIPPMTFLIAEVIAEREGKERLSAVASVLQMANAKEAVARQEREGLLKLIFHGALCWHDGWLNQTPFDEILAKLVGLAPPNRGRWVRSVKLENSSIEDLQKRVVAEEQEGLIHCAHDYLTTWRLDAAGAENPRPPGCYKWKPWREGDFIAETPVMSTKRPGRIKEIPLFQLEPGTGKRFKCGHLRKPNEALDAQLQSHGFPMVMELTYNDRQPSGKIINPKFVRIRDDKAPTQCVSPRVYAEAQYP